MNFESNIPSSIILRFQLWVFTFLSSMGWYWFYMEFAFSNVFRNGIFSKNDPIVMQFDILLQCLKKRMS